jgi:hypothetical protein
MNDGTGSGAGSSVNIKASGFQRKSAPESYWEQQVVNREDSISLVIYDKRIAPNAEGQNIRVNLPADFEAKYAHAIISDTLRRHSPAVVVLAGDGKTADFFLPANSIMSLKFSK